MAFIWDYPSYVIRVCVFIAISHHINLLWIHSRCVVEIRIIQQSIRIAVFDCVFKLGFDLLKFLFYLSFPHPHGFILNIIDGSHLVSVGLVHFVFLTLGTWHVYFRKAVNDLIFGFVEHWEINAFIIRCSLLLILQKLNSSFLRTLTLSRCLLEFLLFWFWRYGKIIHISLIVVLLDIWLDSRILNLWLRLLLIVFATFIFNYRVFETQNLT